MAANDTYGTIPATASSTNFPDDDGFVMDGDFIMSVMSNDAGTIAGTVQMKTPQMSDFEDMPDPDSDQVIDGNYHKEIASAYGIRYRVNVTASTNNFVWRAAGKRK